VSDKAWSGPKVILLFGQHVPAKHSEFAGNGNCRNLMPATGADANKEGSQRPRGFRCRPGRFDQHGSSLAAANLADAAMVRSA